MNTPDKADKWYGKIIFEYSAYEAKCAELEIAMKALKKLYDYENKFIQDDTVWLWVKEALTDIAKLRGQK